MDWSEILRHYDEISGIHPAADLFPMVEGDELRELCADIKERGLQQPIIVWRDGTLLDGRNRLVACYRTNQEVVLETYEGDDPVQFSLSANLYRRHLSMSQRNMTGALAEDLLETLQNQARERQREAAADAAQNRQRDESGKLQVAAPVREAGQPPAPVLIEESAKQAASEQQRPAPKHERTASAQAAKLVGGSARGVEQAMRVKREAPDLVPQVMAGKVTLKEAEREVRQRVEQQRASIPQPETPKVQENITITLVDHKGNPYEYPKPKGKATFNQQKGTEIGWAMWSWNPVTGCNHGCNYCYARAIATSRDMAAYYPAGFTPLFHHERLDAPLNTPVPARAAADPAHGRVFVCSMADLFGAWVPQEWIDRVVASTVANPQWEYLYLTKFPQRYDRLQLPSSGWIGASVDEQHRAEPTLAAMRKVSGVKVKWLSLEPLLEPIKFSTLEGIDMIVIGAQSENIGQNNSFSPPFEWVADLVATARRDGCKVWLKTNLLGQTSGQWPGMQMMQEVPV
jgi:protein gp37/ParB-like chromosome segregation protein Spo0J